MSWNKTASTYRYYLQTCVILCSARSAWGHIFSEVWSEHENGREIFRWFIPVVFDVYK